MKVCQILRAAVFFSALLFLSRCAIPKRLNVNDIPEFGQSGCVVNKTDAFLSYPLYSEPGRLSIYAPDEKIPDFMYAQRQIKKGTRIKIDKVETTWDFENGDRLMIWGSVPIDTKENQFLFQRSFLEEPDAKAYILKFFAPCKN